MTDYFAQTVIPHIIPHADMTPLERLILTHMFSAAPEGDGLYLFSEDGPCDVLELHTRDLKAAFEQSPRSGSRLHSYLAGRIRTPGRRIELDLTGTSWEFFLQDIVRRSRTLTYLSVITSFTCTKMRPDGFGGAATFITARAMKYMSTSAFLETAIGTFETGKPRPPD